MKKIFLFTFMLAFIFMTGAQEKEISKKEQKSASIEKCFNASKSMLLSKRYKFSVQDFVNGHSIPGTITVNGSTALIDMRDWPMQYSAIGYGGKKLRLNYTSEIEDYKLTINEIKKNFDLEFETNFDGERIQYNFEIDACSVAYVSLQTDRRIDGRAVGGTIRPLQ